jgi:hypothetical protein
MNVRQIYHKRIKLTQELLGSMAEEELLDLKSFYDSDSSKYGVELDMAMGKAKQSGEHADAEWFAKTKFAKRVVGQLSQRIQIELSRRKRERTSESADSLSAINFTKELLNAMTMLLDPEVKEQIVELAQTKYGDIPFNIEQYK